jgi:cytochrome o ubiquinol oxidase subunit IV
VTSPTIERGEARSLVLGYVLALLFTLSAFGLVLLHVPTGRQAFYIVLGLGVLQMLVHFRFFLHIDLRRNSRPDLQLLLFSTMIIALMVGGTLVVLFNLHGRMM